MSPLAPAPLGGGQERVRSPWRVFALVGGSSLLLSLNYSLVFVAYGTMGDSFDTDPATLSWALTAFSITVASLLIPAGWLADRFGRKPIVVAGIATFTVGSAFVATAPVVGMLIAGRILQAVGLALEATAAFAVVVDEFPPSQRSTAVGAMGAAGGAAATIGPVVGGALVDSVGWRWTFFVNVPIGAVLAVVVARNLRHVEPTVRRKVPDLVGVGLLATGVGSLALAIVKSNAWGIGSRSIIALFATAVVLLTTLIVRSSHHPDPIVYLPLFKDPQFRRGTGLMLLLAGSFSAMFLTVIRTFTDGWGMSVAAAGAAAAVIPLFGGPLSLAAGRIADRRGTRAVIAPGALVMTVALVLYATQLSDERNVVGLWLPIGALYGIGVGFAHASCQAAAMKNVPTERLGVGGAMSRIAMDVGGVISVAVSVAVIERADDAIIGARRVAGLVAVVCAIGGLLALRLPDTARSRAAS